MPYRFDPTRDLQSNLRQVAADVMEAALTDLGLSVDDPCRSAHQIRKGMKRLRALLRLLRSGLGDTYETENAAAREIARLFAPLREADVLVATLDALAAEGDPRGRATLAPLQDWAGARRQEARDALGADEIEHARALMESLRKRATAWELEGDAALTAGLKRTYERARHHHAALQADGGNSVRRHQWRKQVKYHCHHCELLEPAWPDAIGARHALAAEIGEALGADHDMADCRAALARVAEDDPAIAALPLAGTLAERAGAALQLEAMARAPLLFQEKPKRLARRLSGYWDHAARHAR